MFYNYRNDSLKTVYFPIYNMVSNCATDLEGALANVTPVSWKAEAPLAA